MMTDKQKIQSLIDAAMRSAQEPSRKPERAVPSGVVRTAVVATEAKTVLPVDSASPQQKASDPEPVTPVVELDKEAAEELGKLLDERIVRDRSRRRRAALVSCLVIFGALAGVVSWFVSNGERVEAFKSAQREIRSVTDVNALVESYQGSLDRIAERRNHMDHASNELGVDTTKDQGGDPHMNAEMRELIGDQGGKTVGERKALLAGKFDDQYE